jgi:hypothetical protein
MAGPITPDVYKNAAVKVFKNVSLRITERLDSWDFAVGIPIVDKLVTFLRESRDDLGDISFTFEVRQVEHATGESLTAELLVVLNSKKPVIVVLDRQLRVITTRSLNLKPTLARSVGLCAVSENIVMADYEDRSVVNFYANRSVVSSESLDELGSLPPTRSKFARRGDDYELAIRDHYRNRVKYWQQTDHWQNRKKRVLRKKLGSKNTERIFHSSLLLWLNDHLDAQVRSEPKTVESDEPDIEIASFSGKFFVIEVKWLGTAGSTTYSRPRLAQAIGQMNTYLKKQTTVNNATLVVYDGRKPDDFAALIPGKSVEEGCVQLNSCDGKRLLARGACLTFFLESKTASE